MEPDLKVAKGEETYGVMTSVLDEMIKEQGISIPYLETLVKENINSEQSKKFFTDLYDLLNVPEEYRDIKIFSKDYQYQDLDSDKKDH